MIFGRYEALAVRFAKHPNVITRSSLLNIDKYTLVITFLDHLRTAAGVLIMRGATSDPPLHLVVSIGLIVDSFGEVVKFL